jgi:mono/diheme cytochrome c family protein
MNFGKIHHTGDLAARNGEICNNCSLAAITRTITDGVPNPKQHTGVMPPLGGAQLTQPDVAAVAAYVWSLSHRKAS